MNYLGSDFNSSGSVMAKAELTLARTKRGECVTCGRKCYRKKLFKMIPLDEPGKVLNGRCLNCKPLQAKDVSVSLSVSSLNTSSVSPSGGHTHSRNPSGRSNRSISNIKSGETNRRMAMQKKKKKSSSHLHHHQSRRLNHQHQHHAHQSNSHLHKSKGVANDGTEVSTKGEPKSPPERRNSTGTSTASYRNNAANTRNRFNSTHSSISRGTADTALTTRPSIASCSTMAARKKAGSISTLSIGSVSSAMISSNSLRKCNSSSTSGRSLAIADSFGSRKGNSSSTSGRSLAITDSFGSSACETAFTKTPEISWTPPPSPFEFGKSDDEKDDDDDDDNDLISNRLAVENNINTRFPSRLSSLKSNKSTTSKTCAPTREELEQAAFTLMAARQHGLTEEGGPLYKDMLQELASSDQNLDGGQCSNLSGRAGSPRKKHRSQIIDDSIDANGGKTEDSGSGKKVDSDDDNMNTKLKSGTSLDSSLLESAQDFDAESKRTISNAEQDLEQNSTIFDSNESIPNTVSIAEEDDQVLSMQSHQHLRDHLKVLNRGGAFQPRNAQGHGRPGVGTHVFAGSTRTMSSMSSIGEDDHLLIQNSVEQKNSQIPNRRQNLSRMGSFSRYRQGSCRTLGSMSTIEVIDEEDTKIHSSLEDLSAGSLSADRISVSTPTPSIQPGDEASHEGSNHEEKKENEKDPSDLHDQIRPLTLNSPARMNAPANNRSKKDQEASCDDGTISNLFQEKLIFLRESSDSPDTTRTALEILSEYETTEDDEEENDLGGIAIVVTCMQSHSTIYDVQLWGCRAIQNMSSSRPRVQNAFVQAGAPDTIARAMKHFLESGEDLQDEAISVLSIFAANPSNTNVLVCKGDDAVDAITAAMGQYPGNAGLQTKGCEALAILASHGNSTLRLRIMDKGAGEAILFNAVAMHSDDSIVQKSALSAVLNLSTDCEENQTKLLELGVVDPILSAMKQHRNVAGLQEAGAGAISILAGNNVETKKVIEENGGVKLILRAILDHANISAEKECYVRALMTLALDSYNGNGSESRTSEENEKTARVVNAIIDAIDSPQEGTIPPKLSLAIDAVIMEMEANENNAAVQEVGCAILGGLADLVDEGKASNSDQTKMDIVDEGALDVINMAMVLHKHEARVQQRACAVILSLAIEENYAAIIAAIGIQLLQDAAENFPDRCHDLANTLMQRLGEDQDTEEV